MNTSPSGGNLEQSADNSKLFESGFSYQSDSLKILGLKITLEDTIKSLGGLTTALNFFGSKVSGLSGPIGKVTKLVGMLGGVSVNAMKTFMEVEDITFKTFDQFGVGSENVDHLKTSMYEAGMEMTNFVKGSKQPMELFKEAMDIQQAFSKNFARNIFLAKENVVEIKKASELTNVATKTLVENFAAAAIPMGEIASQMETVAKTLVDMGVNVAGVSDNVTKNIAQLDLYNFKNGVEGLARMAGESARFGTSMEKTFALAEELFDPDKTIEFSNSLAQLGFQTSELSDPLRTLFLVENDPEEFNRQLNKLTEGMFQFNKETGKSMFVGDQRVLRQLATITKKSKEEIMASGKKMEEYRQSLKEMEFSPFKEKDKELLAGLAQFSKDKKGFTVTFTDEKDKKQEKLITELTDEDIKLIGEQYRIKSTEDALKKQLSTNDIMIQLQSSMDASLLQLVVLQQTGNAVSRDIRKSSEKGGPIDEVKKAIITNKEIMNIREKDYLNDPSASLEKDVSGLIDKITTGEYGTTAEDFIYRPGQKPLKFSSGDLVMAIKEEYVSPTFMSTPTETQSFESRLGNQNQEPNTVINSVGGTIELKVVVESNTNMDKEKFENMLYDTGVVMNLQNKIKEAVSNFNLT